MAWLGASLASVRGFPSAARIEVGFQLWRVQLGLLPNDWKPLPLVGRGVREIRIHTGTEHRVIYVADRPEAIYVLHTFQKRSQKTMRRDIELARWRLEQLRRSSDARTEP